MEKISLDYNLNFLSINVFELILFMITTTLLIALKNPEQLTIFHQILTLKGSRLMICYFH